MVGIIRNQNTFLLYQKRKGTDLKGKLKENSSISIIYNNKIFDQDVTLWLNQFWWLNPWEDLFVFFLLVTWKVNPLFKSNDFPLQFENQTTVVALKKKFLIFYESNV